MSDTRPSIDRSSNALQRMSLLTGIPDLLKEFGADLSKVIDGLGVDATIFDSPDNIIPFRTAILLLERSAVASRCAHFGLLLGSRYDHRILGFPGLWMQNAPNLEAALLGFVDLQRGNSRGATVYLHRLGDDFVLGYGLYEPTNSAPTQLYLTIAALMLRSIWALTGGAAKPLEVLLSVREPSDSTPHRAMFAIPVWFGQPETGVVLTKSALAAPIPGARAFELARLRAAAEAAALPSDRIWTDRVRRALRPLLLRGEPTTAAMAESLGVHLRTLARRLAEEGVTFQQLLDEVRYAMARELLATTELPVGAIADALSYSAHSNFNEAFRRWSGDTPSGWRRITRASA